MTFFRYATKEFISSETPQIESWKTLITGQWELYGNHEDTVTPSNLLLFKKALLPQNEIVR